MKALLQRVSRASVTVDGREVSAIGKGLLILLGVEQGDDEARVEKLARKSAELRIFDDGEGHMNLSVRDVGGEALVVSQFTLAASTKKGRRPSFVNAAPPDQATALYDAFADALAGHGVPVKKGVFQAVMQVALVNDGPVTFMLEA